MKVVADHSPFGVRPVYFTTDGQSQGPTIRGLIQKREGPTGWDHDGVRSYLARTPDGLRTCFSGIHAVPPGQVLVETESGLALQPREEFPEPDCSLRASLERAVAGLVTDGRRTAVALSGGLDSAIVVALLRRLGRTDIPVFTLATGLPGYCERLATSATARLLGVETLHVIEVGAEEMIAAFPAAIAAAEVPLFNLHPVHRWLLATALRREGYEVLLTGDGADPVFAGSDPRNYLPIIGALTRAAGMELRSPFFDERVIACAPPPTPGKDALREVAAGWLPAALISRPKTPTYAPPLDTSAFWQEAAIGRLADELGLPPAGPGDDADATLWTALGLLEGLID